MSADKEDTTVEVPTSLPAQQEEVQEEEEESVRELFLQLIICLIFVLGSILYCWLGHLDIQWAKDSHEVPPYVLTADDDWTWYQWFEDDDYVFTIKNDKYWISKYMIIYFSAAFCFVIVGVMEGVFGLQKPWVSGLLTVGGLFGVLSAMVVERDEHHSNIYNAVSVHLYLLEGVLVILLRQYIPLLNDLWNKILIFGDILFCIGSLMDVILSWIYVFSSGKYALASARHETASCYCWLGCALIYTVTTVLLIGAVKGNQPAQKTVNDSPDV